MQRKAMVLAASAALVGVGILGNGVDAAVLLSEVVFNEVGSDVTGEWIEVMNTDQLLPASIGGWGLGDEETSGGTSLTEALYEFPIGTVIAPNDVVVAAVTATRFFTVYGFNPDFEFTPSDPLVPDMIPDATWDPDGGTVNMSNTNDQAVLIDASNNLIDAAGWGNTFAFNPGLGTALDGQSFRRINFTDTDTATDWEVSPDTTVAATRSSPGTLTAIPEPAAVSLLGVAGLALAGHRRRVR
jgi:hypothetical protein